MTNVSNIFHHIFVGSISVLHTHGAYIFILIHLIPTSLQCVIGLFPCALDVMSACKLVMNLEI